MEGDVANRGMGAYIWQRVMKQIQTNELTRRFVAMRPRLMIWAAHILGSDDDAEDALQEAFFRLWRHRTKLEGDYNIEAVSFTALRSSCIDLLRRRSMRRSSPIEDADRVTEQAAEEMADMAEEVKGLIEQRLDPRAKEILTLHDSLGYGYDEIASRLNITEANARLILSRARKTVREAYRDRK